MQRRLYMGAVAAMLAGLLLHPVPAPGQATTAGDPPPSDWPFVRCGEAGGAVWGIVRDPLQLVRSGVQVTINGSGCGTLTDSLGRFGLIGVPSNGSLLRAELIGLQSDSTELGGGADIVRRDLTLSRPSMDDEIVRLRGESSPFNIPRRLAGAVIGCYEVNVRGPYGRNFDRTGGPWATTPAGFPGIPALVLLDTIRSPSDSVALTGRTLRSRLPRGSEPPRLDGNRWRFSSEGDSVIVTWTGSPLIWWIEHRLAVTPDALGGASRYVSHEPGASGVPKSTVWARQSRCDLASGTGG